MINITRLSNGALLIQRDSTELLIDEMAIASALPVVLSSLIDQGRALATARLSGYEAGLIQGRINATIECETSMRIAERQADELVQALAGLGGLTSAA